MSPDDPRHGTPRGHHAGCRLDCCREARNRYERNTRKQRQLTGRGRLVDATGSRRRLQALMRLGWPSRILAEKARIQRGQQGVDAILRKSQKVTAWRAADIAKVYDELSMTLGPSNITRLRAEAKGWPPPLAWDDDRIDDPAYNPMGLLTNGVHRPRRGSSTRSAIDEAVVLRVLSGENLPTSKAERAEIMRRWIDNGGSEAELCRRMGWRAGRYGSRGVGGVSQPGDQPDERKAS